MKLTCILRAAVGHTVHELAEAPAEGPQSCSWRPGLATKTRDQEGAQERPRRGVVAQRASNFLSLRIRSITVFDRHRVLFCRRVCDKLLLEYITEMRVQMRGHSERSGNAFRAEPFRTFRYPWQPRAAQLHFDLVLLPQVLLVSIVVTIVASIVVVPSSSSTTRRN